MDESVTERFRVGLAATPADPRFWCQTLGRFALYRDRDDSAAVMQAGKPLALLAYVALSPSGRAERDHVAELLWPGSSSRDARHALSQSLYRLRTATGDVDLVRLDGPTLEFTNCARLDCVEGEAAAASDDLTSAYDLLLGAFLEGFSIPDAREFDEWVEARRARYLTTWSSVAQRLAERHIAAGEPSRAVEIADVLASRRPFDDEPVRLVMSALSARGRHAMAVARYAAYVQVLRGQEDQPGDGLRRYSEELEQFVLSRALDVGAELPFVGREEPWSQLEAAWESAQNARPGAVLVEGAAGLGKTRIVAELSARVEAGGGLTLAAKCYEPEGAVPYGAIAGALAAAVQHPGLDDLDRTWLAEAARVLPELHERFPDLPRLASRDSPVAAKQRLHRALARYLEAICMRSPVLLVIDDVHWADPSSLEVLHLLRSQLEDARLLLVASYRPVELSPAARSFVRSLAESRLAHLIVLEPLTSEAVKDLLNELGSFDDVQTGQAVTPHLHRHSGGNPLFLSELLDALDRDRVLFVREGRWTWGRDREIGALPNTLGKLLADRIERLTPWTRACVEVLAVAAEEVTVEVLACAVDISEPRAGLALSVLEEERLVRRTRVGSYDLMHDELRRHVYQGIPDERRRALHEAVGLALEDLGVAKRPGGPARLVHHFDQAGDPDRARRYALQAAGDASALAAPASLRSHLDLAAAHAPRVLPPGETPRWMMPFLGSGRSAFRGRLTVGVVGAASLAFGLLAGAYLRPIIGGPDEDYRQGVIYLGTSTIAGPTHEIVWASRLGEPGSLSIIEAPPAGFGPRIVQQWVTERGETHAKLFRIEGADTIQISYGSSDDYAGAGSWSPDGALLAVHRGWRAGPEQYKSNIFLLDSLGRDIRQLTHTEYQDHEAIWSPLGTHLLVFRDSLGHRSLWLHEVGGEERVDLTSRFGLPDIVASAGLSAQGDHVAAISPDDGSARSALYIMDLQNDELRTVRLLERSANAELLWSPDDRWIAFVAPRDDSWTLQIISADGTGGPFVAVQLPQQFTATRWTGDEPRYVARVSIDSEIVSLTSGHGTQLQATARAPSGDVLSTNLRWTVVDTSVARVDGAGFVRGRASGTTRVLVSAGGFRADTVAVIVAFAPVDTLFQEDWSHGLDLARWRPIGYPRPEVVDRGVPDGQAAFANRGDYNHHSGAASLDRFAAGQSGFTVEAEGWVRFTGAPFQDWALGLISSAAPIDDELFGRGTIALGLSGPSPVFADAQWGGCVSGPELRTGRLELQAIHERWFQAAIVVRPDGIAECYLDGVLHGTGQIPEASRTQPFSVLLSGRSSGTDIYHGRVTVTRGLRY